MHLLWIDDKRVEGRKEDKDEEIKGKVIQSFGAERESQSVRTVHSWKTAWVRAKKRGEKHIEQEKIVRGKQ